MRAVFIISGNPKGKARPRMGRNGVYTPSGTKEYEKQVAFEYTMQCRGSFFSGTVNAHITVYYAPPKSASKRQREQMLNGAVRPAKKPDLDNIAKIILDSLNGVAYRDDADVISLWIEKYYRETAAVIVELSDG